VRRVRQGQSEKGVGRGKMKKGRRRQSEEGPRGVRGKVRKGWAGMKKGMRGQSEEGSQGESEEELIG
jgi:hypothetical protein